MPSSPVSFGIPLSMRGAEDDVLSSLGAVDMVRVSAHKTDFRPKRGTLAQGSLNSQ